MNSLYSPRTVIARKKLELFTDKKIFDSIIKTTAKKVKISLNIPDKHNIRQLITSKGKTKEFQLDNKKTRNTTFDSKQKTKDKKNNFEQKLKNIDLDLTTNKNPIIEKSTKIFKRKVPIKPKNSKIFSSTTFNSGVNTKLEFNLNTPKNKIKNLQINTASCYPTNHYYSSNHLTTSSGQLSYSKSLNSDLVYSKSKMRKDLFNVEISSKMYETNKFLQLYNDVLTESEKDEIQKLNETKIFYYRKKNDYQFGLKCCNNRKNTALYSSTVTSFYDSNAYNRDISGRVVDLNKKKLFINSSSIVNISTKNSDKSVSMGYKNYINKKVKIPNLFINSNDTERKSEVTCDYDDFCGYLKVEVHDHLIYRYEILSSIAKSTFSETFKCKDHKLNKFVCIKILINQKSKRENNKDKNDKNLFELNEVKIIEAINQMDTNSDSNIYRLLNKFVFRNHNVSL